MRDETNNCKQNRVSVFIFLTHPILGTRCKLMQVDGFFYLHQFASEKKLLLLSSSSQQKSSRCERQRDGEKGGGGGREQSGKKGVVG